MRKGVIIIISIAIILCILNVVITEQQRNTAKYEIKTTYDVYYTNETPIITDGYVTFIDSYTKMPVKIAGSYVIIPIKQ